MTTAEVQADGSFGDWPVDLNLVEMEMTRRLLNASHARRAKAAKGRRDPAGADANLFGAAGDRRTAGVPPASLLEAVRVVPTARMAPEDGDERHGGNDLAACHPQ
ncbi:MAG: hypothetical protein IPO67_21675 [Deltaproteobacteria bacterium]|nr:hypothetical protein [Deltaproteobacteria bacterium]